MRILLVEDEKLLSAALCKVLKRAHFETDTAYTGPDGLDCALSGIYDAIILDVMLPGLDGFSILTQLRQANVSTPILMLTARGGLEDRVNGLERGADYYLPKPFEMAELLACLHAITRRRGEIPRMGLTFCDLELMTQTGRLRCTTTGQDVRLGGKEFHLMELFLRNSGQILPRELIMERVWGHDNEAEYNTLEVYVSFLRKKLSFLGSSVKIKVSRGLGYALEEPS